MSKSIDYLFLTVIVLLLLKTFKINDPSQIDKDSLTMVRLDNGIECVISNDTNNTEKPNLMSCDFSTRTDFTELNSVSNELSPSKLTNVRLGRNIVTKLG